MSKKDSKIIPTLEDVIKPGVHKDTQIGDLSAIDDDLDTANFKLKARASTKPNDELFTEDFDRIFAAAESSQNTLPDEIVKRPSPKEISAKEIRDAEDSIADIIVAERFKPEDSIMLVAERHDPGKKTAPAPRRAGAAVPGTAVPETPAKANTPANTTTQAKTGKEAPAATAGKTIRIGELVDEISRQLMPELELKIRSRVREILEKHLNIKK